MNILLGEKGLHCRWSHPWSLDPYRCSDFLSVECLRCLPMLPNFGKFRLQVWFSCIFQIYLLVHSLAAISVAGWSCHTKHPWNPRVIDSTLRKKYRDTKLKICFWQLQPPHDAGPKPEPQRSDDADDGDSDISALDQVKSWVKRSLVHLIKLHSVSSPPRKLFSAGMRWKFTQFLICFRRTFQGSVPTMIRMLKLMVTHGVPLSHPAHSQSCVVPVARWVSYRAKHSLLMRGKMLWVQEFNSTSGTTRPCCPPSRNSHGPVLHTPRDKIFLRRWRTKHPLNPVLLLLVLQQQKNPVRWVVWEHTTAKLVLLPRRVQEATSCFLFAGDSSAFGTCSGLFAQAWILLRWDVSKICRRTVGEAEGQRPEQWQGPDRNHKLSEWRFPSRDGKPMLPLRMHFFEASSEPSVSARGLQCLHSNQNVQF